MLEQDSIAISYHCLVPLARLAFQSVCMLAPKSSNILKGEIMVFKWWLQIIKIKLKLVLIVVYSQCSTSSEIIGK